MWPRAYEITDVLRYVRKESSPRKIAICGIGRMGRKCHLFGFFFVGGPEQFVLFAAGGNQLQCSQKRRSKHKTHSENEHLSESNLNHEGFLLLRIHPRCCKAAFNSHLLRRPWKANRGCAAEHERCH